MHNIKMWVKDKVHQDIKEVAAIHWIEEVVLLWMVKGNLVRLTVERDFDEVEFVRLDKEAEEDA